MSKKLAMFSIVIVLSIVGLVFVGGCDEDATAASGENKNISQEVTQAGCPKTLDCPQKKTCTLKTDQGCPPDCKMQCCQAKQKAGTCPVQSDKTSYPKVCPKQCDAK